MIFRLVTKPWINHSLFSTALRYIIYYLDWVSSLNRKHLAKLDLSQWNVFLLWVSFSSMFIITNIAKYHKKDFWLNSTTLRGRYPYYKTKHKRAMRLHLEVYIAWLHFQIHRFYWFKIWHFFDWHLKNGDVINENFTDLL